MIIQTLLFYIFSFTLLASGLAVVSARNPVHSVLFLILAFFNAAGLFVLLGAEFVAMLLVIVYVGAVAVLFLFVVMMLDVNFAVMREGFMRYLPLGIAVAVVLFAELFLILKASTLHPATLATVAVPLKEGATNTEVLGQVLYTKYLYPFEMAGVILLVAMIGAIVLTLRQREGVRKQNISEQVNRKREDCVQLVHVEPGKGI